MGEDERERLKSALWFAVGKMVDEQLLQLDRNATPQFIGALAEMVWVQLESVATDLEAFSTHAGRTSVSVADVLLLTRKNQDLRDLMSDFIDRQKAAALEAEAPKGRPGAKPRAGAGAGAGPRAGPRAGAMARPKKK